MQQTQMYMRKSRSMVYEKQVGKILNSIRDLITTDVLAIWRRLKMIGNRFYVCLDKLLFFKH